jgi:GH15 family glucan-1,4-alpha-glucosidase
VTAWFYRYNPTASPDGLPGSEGTCSLCSFLSVDALARAGRLDEARYSLEKVLTYANHVGLYSEEIQGRGGLGLPTVLNLAAGQALHPRER